MQGSQFFYDAAGTGTATLLRTGYTSLHTVEVENPNTVPVYLQLFDAVGVSSVTLGTTVPTSTRYIPAGDGTENGVRILDFVAPVRASFGYVYAITTTRNGLTAPGSACPLNFTYS